MTTIVATFDSEKKDGAMVGDTWITYAVSFKGSPKIWAAAGCAWGGAGGTGPLDIFRLWTEGHGKRPEFNKKDKEEDDEEETAKLEILQLHPTKGLHLWINGDPPLKVDEAFYAIGTGAAFAIGALERGATISEALEIAARRDKGTQLPGHIITVADLLPKRRTRK